MGKQLKVGIIGLGVGEKHIEGFRSHPACEVTALCDFSADKARKAAKRYPYLRITRRADKILKDPSIDVVSVASYDNYHFGQIMLAIKNGKHVFAEKPLCLYENEAARIRAALERNPQVKLSSNLILRQSPRFRYLKGLINRGGLGDIFYVEGDYNYGRLQKITEGWRGKIDFYSVVYGGGIHIIDLFLWLTGNRIVEVEAYGNRIASKGSRFKYNDMVAAILKFKNGLIGKMSANFGCVMPHFHNLAVYGTKATFVNGATEGLLFKSRSPGARPQKICAAYPGVHKGDLIYSFIDSILGNSRPEVSAEDTFASMSVCLAIEKATRQGGPVKVRYF